MGADYEMNGLASGLNYFVRVKAENAAGACASSMQFIPDCGAFIPTSPSAIVPRGAPAAPVALVASVLDVQSVRVNWTAPASIGAIVSYRVDAYTKSVKATAAESSFYGDNEVHMIISHHSHLLNSLLPLLSTPLTTFPIHSSYLPILLTIYLFSHVLTHSPTGATVVHGGQWRDRRYLHGRLRDLLPAATGDRQRVLSRHCLPHLRRPVALPTTRYIIHHSWLTYSYLNLLFISHVYPSQICPTHINPTRN